MDVLHARMMQYIRAVSEGSATARLHVPLAQLTEVEVWCAECPVAGEDMGILVNTSCRRGSHRGSVIKQGEIKLTGCIVNVMLKVHTI